MFDLVGGMRRLQKEAGRRMPVQRNRRPKLAVVSTPIVAVASVAAVVGLVFWDERRRIAMRQRMEQLAGSVSASVKSSVNRVAPTVPTPAGKD